MIGSRGNSSACSFSLQFGPKFSTLIQVLGWCYSNNSASKLVLVPCESHEQTNTWLAQATRGHFFFNHLKLRTPFFFLHSPVHLFLSRGWGQRKQTHGQTAARSPSACLPSHFIDRNSVGSERLSRRPLLLFIFTHQLKDVKFSSCNHRCRRQQGKQIAGDLSGARPCVLDGNQIKVPACKCHRGIAESSQRRWLQLQKRTVWVKEQSGGEFTYLYTRYAQFYAEFLY